MFEAVHGVGKRTQSEMKKILLRKTKSVISNKYILRGAAPRKVAFTCFVFSYLFKAV